MRKELDSIKQQLHQVGFINFNKNLIKKNDSVYLFQYKLKQQTKTIKITIDKKDLLEQLLKKDYTIHENIIEIPFNTTTMFLHGVNEFYETKSNSFTKVNLENIEFIENYAKANLSIQISPQRKIDKIIINGYKKFPKKYINNHLFFNKENLFHEKSTHAISERINTIPFASEIKKPQVLFLKDSTLIYMYLKKKKINQLDGLIGFISNENSKIDFNGHLNLALSNAFNQGEQLKLQWKSTTNQNKQLHIFTDIPYIFNTKFNPQFNFSIFSQDSSYVNIDSKTIINYHLNHKSKIGAIVQTRNSNNLNETATIFLKDFQSIFYGMSYSYKKPIDNIFYEHKYLLDVNLLFGNQKNETTNNKKRKIKMIFEYLFDLNTKNKIRFKNNSSFILSNNYLENELYKIGGVETIRGFKEQSIPVSKFSSFNIEYNYLINKKTALYSITDFTYFQNDIADYNDLLFGIGLGYKTKLKSSVLNINYTFGFAKKQSLRTSNALLNIEFKNIF